MPLNETKLTSDLIELANKIDSKNLEDGTTPEQVKQIWAQDMAKALKEFVLTLTVESTHIPALVAPNGPVTGTIETTNTLS